MQGNDPRYAPPYSISYLRASDFVVTQYVAREAQQRHASHIQRRWIETASF